MTNPLPATTPLHLFDAVGIELEYMIVDRERLDVRPIADTVLRDETGAIASEVEHGDIAWSNELVAHVIELKTNGPAAGLVGLAAAFQKNVDEVNRQLSRFNARLLPTAMHPWMDPHADSSLWPHEYGPVYETFDRIFDCRGHGWANLQSMHINLPFCGDEEFGRLHAAIRLLLPLLPALAASSPLMDGQLSGLMDSRLEVYRTNSIRIPSVAGRVIPEQAFDERSYGHLIFEPMFADIAPHDPRGVLRNEFLNARGAIARFSRGTIEIRVLDVQECPAADLAIATAVTAVLKQLIAERWTSREAQQAVPIEPLEAVLLAAIRNADRAVISSPMMLEHFGVTESAISLAELWRHLMDSIEPADAEFAQARSALDVILQQGPLARRITENLSDNPSREELRAVYNRLSDCLSSGTMFA